MTAIDKILQAQYAATGGAAGEAIRQMQANYEAAYAAYGGPLGYAAHAAKAQMIAALPKPVAADIASCLGHVDKYSETTAAIDKLLQANGGKGPLSQMERKLQMEAEIGKLMQGMAPTKRDGEEKDEPCPHCGK